MYVLKEFNQRHAKDIAVSQIVYLALASILFFLGRSFFESATIFLIILTLALIVAHGIRIANLLKSSELSLARSEKLAMAGALAVTLFFFSFAFVNSASSSNAPQSELKSIYFPVVLGGILSVYADFLIAALVRRLNNALIAGRR